tara:strand:+ start:672 stop:1046 length:375 start_codon:yes stop_codon:yes gene_type:complete
LPFNYAFLIVTEILFSPTPIIYFFDIIQRFKIDTLVLAFTLLETFVTRLSLGNGSKQDFNMATFRKRNNTWTARITFEGRKIAKSFTNKDHAKRCFAEQNRLLKTELERVFAPVPLVELADYVI